MFMITLNTPEYTQNYIFLAFQMLLNLSRRRLRKTKFIQNCLFISFTCRNISFHLYFTLFVSQINRHYKLNICHGNINNFLVQRISDIKKLDVMFYLLVIFFPQKKSIRLVLISIVSAFIHLILSLNSLKLNHAIRM